MLPFFACARRHFKGVCVGLLSTLPLIASAQVGATWLTSADSGRFQQGNDVSSDPSISGDGRFIAFYSAADNLVPGDTNLSGDIFVHDNLTGLTERVSVSSFGEQAEGYSFAPSISADGRFVVFDSQATNLVLSDTNSADDVFLFDRETGQTERISVSSTGEPGDGPSLLPSISADGRFISFVSYASNLVAGDTNSRADVFLRDRQSNQTFRVSISSSGNGGNGDSFGASISADGRFIVFGSKATDLVPGDTNNFDDIFLHDRQTGQTTRVSQTTQGVQANEDSFNASISADGGFIAFESDASNLVPGDTNNYRDIFIQERETRQIGRVIVPTTGQQANGNCSQVLVCANGRFLVFTSGANNLVPGDNNEAGDIFVYDLRNARVSLISVSSTGAQGVFESFLPVISADGRFIAFESFADNLAPGDANNKPDIFVHQFRENIIGDIDKNLCVDDFDLLLLSQDFLSVPGSASGQDTDLNDDGAVDDFDLFLLTQHFLDGC